MTCIKSKTIAYGINKKRIELKLKRDVTNELNNLEKKQTNTEKDEERYNYLVRQLKTIEFKEIEGHKTRIKRLPNYEQKEPDIHFYANLEKK